MGILSGKRALIGGVATDRSIAWGIARVLAGDADHVRLNGIDRWIGGVHLRGRYPRWRWDDGTETIAVPAEQRQ